eukprot:CAMPEP_0119143686 /NCGR_PEP_ID=MMETSP1310-20130426/34686_1 /TAXON_ID=464262 /ORGANISM="Genus nov. species nov., Strain RCC2339" /LENGTH=139 /DNA_ID=CAMNT_0007135331 /DNA_START=25 /DNA_END=441 /DNA_ORIENTATION=+
MTDWYREFSSRTNLRDQEREAVFSTYVDGLGWHHQASCLVRAEVELLGNDPHARLTNVWSSFVEAYCRVGKWDEGARIACQYERVANKFPDKMALPLLTLRRASRWNRSMDHTLHKIHELTESYCQGVEVMKCLSRSKK